MITQPTEQLILVEELVDKVPIMQVKLVDQDLWL